MSSAVSRQPGWQQGSILVLTGFLPIMAIIALAPTLPTLLAHFKDIGHPELLVPLLLTAPSACIALLSPAAGLVTDRFGRRRLMLASMVLYGIGGLVPFFYDSFGAVVAGRVLIGIAEAGILTVTNTLMADYYEGDVRYRWLMIQGLAGSVLGSCLMALAGFLASIGWQWPFAVYAVAFPAFVAAWFFLYEPQRREPAVVPDRALSAGKPFPLARAVWLSVATLVIAIVYFVQPIHFSLVLKQLGVADPKAIGLISAIPSLGVPTGSIVFKLLSRRGPALQMGLALALYAVGLAGIGWADAYPTALGFAFLQQMGSGLVVPGLLAWAQSQFGFEHRGRGMGLWTAAFFMGQFVSPVVVHGMQGLSGGLQPAFMAFGALAFIGACGVMLRLRHPALVGAATGPV